MKSFLLLILLGFIISNVLGFIGFFLVVVLAEAISGGVSFAGFPTGIILAIWIGLIASVILLPVIIYITLKIYQNVAGRVKLPILRKLITIPILVLVLGYTPLSFGGGIVSSYVGQFISNSKFDVDVTIQQEQLKLARTSHPAVDKYKFAYLFTLSIDNKTGQTLKDVAISSYLYNGSTKLFNEDIYGKKIDLKSGNNAFTYEYIIDMDSSFEKINPDDIELHISFRKDNVSKMYKFPTKLKEWEFVAENKKPVDVWYELPRRGYSGLSPTPEYLPLNTN